MRVFSTGSSISYNNRLKEFLPGGTHYNFRSLWDSKPIHFVKGRGMHVWDLDGNEYLDFASKFGANILGHSHEEYIDCLKKALNRAMAVQLGDIELGVTEMIHKCLPSCEMVRFNLSGTEAVQNALRLARAYTGRDKFVRFVGHYHGNADNIMGGRVESSENPIPIEFSGDFNGTMGRASGIMGAQSYLLPWNDIDALKELLCRHGNSIAAVIMEPICVNGGGVLPREGYLKNVRKLCTDYGVVLIFDEIITGFRVGLSGAQGMFGIKPDITTLGKAIAGGALPVSVVGGKKEIMKLYENRMVIHAGTFNGYPLGLAAVDATLSILGKDDGRCLRDMSEKMSVINEIFVRAAHLRGIDIKKGGLDACTVYSYAGEADMADIRNRRRAQHMKVCVNAALKEHGILLSNASRMYGNISLKTEDIEMFSELINEALDSAVIEIEKISERSRGGK